MKRGIQYQNELSIAELEKSGFHDIEVPYGTDLKQFEQSTLKIVGVILRLRELTTIVFEKALTYTKKCKAEYLVLDTREVSEKEVLQKLISTSIRKITGSDVDIYLENGYISGKDGKICYSDYSETKDLSVMVKEFNNMTGKKNFGICVNMGYVNLLVQNVRRVMEYAGDDLKLVHMNDNDGFSDQHQMPYTFTTGRGDRSTDLYRAIGALIRMKYQGYLVFDTIGVFKRIPGQVQGAFLNMLNSIEKLWEEEFSFEEKLNQPNKKLVLFGAGVMAGKFIHMWGDKYPPVFLVDNNKDVWGTKRGGFEIKSPDAILEIPSEQRNVLICNMYYDEIGKQLKEMGIEYQCFWDQYYI